MAQLPIQHGKVLKYSIEKLKNKILQHFSSITLNVACNLDLVRKVNYSVCQNARFLLVIVSNGQSKM
jgi:hypothetical protein